MLHEWKENRSMNVALKRTLDGALNDDALWQRFSAEERARALEVLRYTLETVRATGDMLRSSMDSLRKQIPVDSGQSIEALGVERTGL